MGDMYHVQKIVPPRREGFQSTPQPPRNCALLLPDAPRVHVAHACCLSFSSHAVVSTSSATPPSSCCLESTSLDAPSRAGRDVTHWKNWRCAAGPGLLQGHVSKSTERQAAHSLPLTLRWQMDRYEEMTGQQRRTQTDSTESA